MLSKRYVYTHEGTNVELWATPEGLSVRNGKRWKPVVVQVPAIEFPPGFKVDNPDAMEQNIAEAFFAGLTYHA